MEADVELEQTPDVAAAMNHAHMQRDGDNRSEVIWMSETDKLSAETCLIVTDLLRRKVSTIEESIVMDESHVDEMPFLEKYIDKQSTICICEMG